MFKASGVLVAIVVATAVVASACGSAGQASTPSPTAPIATGTPPPTPTPEPTPTPTPQPTLMPIPTKQPITITNGKPGQGFTVTRIEDRPCEDPECTPTRTAIVITMDEDTPGTFDAMVAAPDFDAARVFITDCGAVIQFMFQSGGTVFASGISSQNLYFGEENLSGCGSVTLTISGYTPVTIPASWVYS